MKEIPLTKGFSALVDDEDYPRVSQHKWRALVRKSARKSRVYVARHEGWPDRKTILLHRFLTDAPAEMVVDHINGDTLDNRRANLRVCTQAQNLANQGPKFGCSGFKGVHRHRGKWKVTISSAKEMHYLGVFQNIEDAARAYDDAAKRLHGEFARLNFPAAA